MQSSAAIHPQFHLNLYIIPKVLLIVQNFSTFFPALATQSEAFADATYVLFSETFQRKESCLDQKTGYKKRQIQYDLRRGHVFINQIYTVPRGILYLEVIIYRTG